ncbi:MAG: peptide deformylase [Atopobiaceae bacterium]|nr:peptide deformylase [Atopobiaceae bacterium]
MIKELVKDTAILSQRCEAGTAEDAELAQDLIDTVQSLEDASCLAANQIGVTKSVVVYVTDDGEAHVMFNPRIMMGLRASKMMEACLTLEEPSKVTRYDKIKVAYQELVDGELKDRRRDFTGWEAQMIQHMVDHCRGKLV